MCPKLIVPLQIDLAIDVRRYPDLMSMVPAEHRRRRTERVVV